MSFQSLLNQSITISNKSGYDRYGKETTTGNTVVSARVEVKNQVKLLGNGETYVVNAIAFLPSTTTVNIDDKISYNGVDYKVLNKELVKQANGTTHHLELELRLWQN